MSFNRKPPKGDNVVDFKPREPSRVAKEFSRLDAWGRLAENHSSGDVMRALGWAPYGHRIYTGGKVYEGQGPDVPPKLLSEKVGEWEGGPVMAPNDPNRQPKPKGWR